MLHDYTIIVFSHLRWDFVFQRPQHLLGTIGLVSFALGALGMIYLGITWMVNLGQLPYTTNAEFPHFSSNYPPLWSYLVSIPMAWLGPGLATWGLRSKE